MQSLFAGRLDGNRRIADGVELHALPFNLNFTLYSSQTKLIVQIIVTLGFSSSSSLTPIAVTSQWIRNEKMQMSRDEEWRVQCFARWTEQHQIGIIDGRVENRQTKEFNNNNGNKEILRQITATTMSWMRRRKFSRRMFSLKIHQIAFYFYYLMICWPYRPRLVTGIHRHLAHTLCAFNNYRFFIFFLAHLRSFREAENDRFGVTF